MQRTRDQKHVILSQIRKMQSDQERQLLRELNKELQARRRVQLLD